MKSKRTVVFITCFLIAIACLVIGFYIKGNKLNIEQYKTHKRSIVGTQLLYANSEKVIMYDTPGLFVYDLKKNELRQVLDFPANGIDSLQGSDAHTILVSNDGNTVFIKSANNINNKVYDVQADKLSSTDIIDLDSYFNEYLYDFSQYNSIFEDETFGYPDSTPIMYDDILYYLTNSSDTDLSRLRIVICENGNFKTFNVWE